MRVIERQVGDERVAGHRADRVRHPRGPDDAVPVKLVDEDVAQAARLVIATVARGGFRPGRRCVSC
ncbi:hypothetical protein ACWDA3_22125 [Nonomuraea rubra]